MNIRLNNLNKTIINCKKCPRLVNFINKVSTEKRKQNINEIYWGKPVPGFGDLDSKLAFIALKLISESIKACLNDIGSATEIPSLINCLVSFPIVIFNFLIFSFKALIAS